MRRDDLLEPDAAFEHDETEHALDEVDQLAEEINRDDIQRRKVDERIDKRNRDRPDVNAVEQKSNQRFAAGAQREIAAVRKREDRHTDGGNEDKPRRQRADGIGRFIDERDKRRGGSQQHAYREAAGDGKKDQLRRRILGLAVFARAELLADENGDGAAERLEDDVEEIGDCRRDVQRRDDGQPARGIALDEESHADGPQQLVNQQRHAAQDDVFDQTTGDFQASVYAPDEAVDFSVPVRADGDDRQLDKAGNDGRGRGAGDAVGRKAEAAEDQHVVQHEVCENGDDRRFHRQHRRACFAERAGVNLCERERNQTERHDFQVIQPISRRRGDVADILLAAQVEVNQLFAEKKEDCEAGGADNGGGDQLETKRIAHALVIAGTVKLCGENARARQTAENTEIENKQQLVGDGDAGHLIGSDLSDHHVV